MSKPQVAPGQLPAFFPDKAEKPVVELPYVGPGVNREEIVYRAGTRLDYRWTHKIEGRGRRGVTLHGLYDESQRIYQAGGEMSQFIFWKRKIVSLSIEPWRRISAIADWVEIVDHERNECWRISMKKFVKHAVKYNAGIGDRVGCDMDLWDRINSHGTYVHHGKRD